MAGGKGATPAVSGLEPLRAGELRAASSVHAPPRNFFKQRTSLALVIGGSATLSSTRVVEMCSGFDSRRLSTLPPVVVPRFRAWTLSYTFPPQDNLCGRCYSANENSYEFFKNLSKWLYNYSIVRMCCNWDYGKWLLMWWMEAFKITCHWSVICAENSRDSLDFSERTLVVIHEKYNMWTDNLSNACVCKFNILTSVK